MGFISTAEMDQLMERIHLEVFGRKISDRRRERRSGWNTTDVDYSQYDRPTFTR